MIPRVLLLALLLGAISPSADAADVRFLSFGDSITVGHGDGSILCPDNISPTGGYPPRLRSQLAANGIDAEFVNRGVCGERTSSGLSRLDSVLAAGGDAIIVMEGTNDVSAGVGFESTLFNLNAMMIKAQLAEVIPILASVIPRGPEVGQNGKTFTIAERLREDAQENGWLFADQFHVFWDRPDFFETYYFDQLHPASNGYDLIADEFLEPAIDAATTQNLCAQIPSGQCAVTNNSLCLNQGRFRLQAMWTDFAGQTGVGTAVPQTDDTGAFYFFSPDNIELVIKVLDGRTLNGHFWVFYGALSDVEFELAVRDTETGECREYFNPLGTFASVGDTQAFFDGDIPGPD